MVIGAEHCSAHANAGLGRYFHMQNIGRKNSLRMPGANYNAAGVYFITPCVQDHAKVFGEVILVDDVRAEQCSARTGSAAAAGAAADGSSNVKMQLNAYGEIAYKYWQAIPEFYPNVRIDAFVVMPSHVHGLIIIDEMESSPASAPVRGERCSVHEIMPPMYPEKNYLLIPPRHYGLISKIVKGYKEAVVKEIRSRFNDHAFRWHRSFHDHIVRNEDEFRIYQRYIQNNPLKWWLKRHTYK